MSDDDLFSAFESERTVIKPSGGRGPRPASPPAQPLAGGDSGGLSALPKVAGTSALMQAALPLLRAAPQIRAMAHHPNPGALRAALAEGIQRFESQARASGLGNEQVIGGRYVLCSLLDESASGTPWGSAGNWSSHSLLVHFHNEAWGGEKVFQLMGKLAEDVPKHRDLLELMYAALALGFEGRYRVLDNGAAQLTSVRERLAQMLQHAAPAVDKALSPHWTGAPAAAPSLRDGIPLWVVATASALLLAVVFALFRFAIQDRSDATFEALAGIAPARAAALLPPAPAERPRLATFLKPEIEAQLVEVRDLADRSVVVLRGDRFFEPGSADVHADVQPLLMRIGAAMADLPGPVLVTGHSDNQPIRSLRFPSNWHLSQERANHVKSLLATRLPPSRLRAEGRADSEPVAANDGPAGRARNRRVEITLFTQE